MATALLEDAPLRSSLDAARADDNRTARPRRLIQMRALIAIAIAVSLARTTTFAAPAGALPPGEYVWEPELSPSGPLVILVSLPDQTLSAYRNGIRIAYSSISSGRQGRNTPPGVFTILEKEVTHFSNKYHHAPMPYMQRLTWEGVAMHAGELPGYPASHGCIRLPHEFAKKLYSITTRGTTVVVADEKRPALTYATHPGILLTAANEQTQEGDLQWDPELSAEGPVTILASGTDKALYVYRNGIRIARGRLEVIDPDHSLGSHAFTMLEGVAENESPFAPGRPAHRWMAIRTQGQTTLEDLAKRVRVTPELLEKLYDLLAPGTTIVVTDAPALNGSPKARSIFVIESAPRPNE